MDVLQRIVSLVPSNTEILFYLGLQDSVVGVTENCDFPEAAKAKDKMGTFGQPQLAKIIAQAPELVLVDRGLHKKIIEELHKCGVKVLAAAPATIEDVFSLISEIGRLGGVAAKAKALVSSLQERVNQIRHKPLEVQPRVFRLMSVNPFITPGPGAFQYDALKIAGAQLMNIQAKAAYVQVAFEQIVEFDPEIIFFCGIEKGQRLPPKCTGCAARKPICHRTVDDIITGEWQQITAVQRGRVYPIPCHTICRPGPRLIDGLEQLHNFYFKK